MFLSGERRPSTLWTLQIFTLLVIRDAKALCKRKACKSSQKSPAGACKLLTSPKSILALAAFDFYQSPIFWSRLRQISPGCRESKGTARSMVVLLAVQPGDGPTQPALPASRFLKHPLHLSVHKVCTQETSMGKDTNLCTGGRRGFVLL